MSLQTKEVSFGAPGAIRTRGLSLRRRTLYPTELRKHTNLPSRKFGTANRFLVVSCFFNNLNALVVTAMLTYDMSLDKLTAV